MEIKNKKNEKFEEIGAKEFNRRTSHTYEEFNEEYMTEDGESKWPFKIR